MSTPIEIRCRKIDITIHGDHPFAIKATDYAYLHVVFTDQWLLIQEKWSESTTRTWAYRASEIAEACTTVEKDQP